MRRNPLDLARYLARLAALFNVRRRGRSLLPLRPFRTPAAPVAILVTFEPTCGQGMRSLKGRDPLA